MADNECELACDELGIKVVVTFDPTFYDEDEIIEINEMLARVISAWHRRRETTFCPKSYFVGVR